MAHENRKKALLKKHGLAGVNKPKRTPGHKTKSHMVLAQDGHTLKLIRFGQKGAKTAGKPKAGESARMKAKRKSFKARHAKNIAGMVGAPACGDVMKLQIKLNNDVIEDVKFKTYGCGSAIASSTMFVDMLKGKTIAEAKLIKDKDIAAALELPPIKLHCSVLAEDSIRHAIEDWEKKTAHRKHNYYKE
jgi:NifU-like protein involved in Fe-S cluster formation